MGSSAGIVCMLLAVISGLLGTISTPYIRDMNIVHVTFPLDAHPAANSTQQVFWGAWGYCSKPSNSKEFTCKHTGLGYAVEVNPPTGGLNKTIGASYTRGLIFHPIAFAFTFIALICACGSEQFMAWFAVVFALIAFAVDLALYQRVWYQCKHMQDAKADTAFGPAFWLNIVQFKLTGLYLMSKNPLPRDVRRFM